MLLGLKKGFWLKYYKLQKLYNLYICKETGIP